MEQTPKRPVNVGSTRNEAFAAFNVLALMLKQPDTARDIYAVFSPLDMIAVGRFTNRLADSLNVARPRLHGGYR